MKRLRTTLTLCAAVIAVNFTAGTVSSATPPGTNLTGTIDLSPGPDVYTPPVFSLNHNTHKLYTIGAPGYDIYAMKVVDINASRVVTGIDFGTYSLIGNPPSNYPFQPVGVAVDESTVAAGNKVYVVGRIGTSQVVLRTVDGVTDTNLTDQSSDVVLPIFSTPGTISGSNMVVNPVTHKVYVSDSNGNLVVVDGPGRTVLKTIAPAPNAQVYAVNTAGNKVFVFGDKGGTIIDGVSDALTNFSTTFFPFDAVADSAGGRIYCVGQDRNNGAPGIYVLDANSGATLASNTIDVPLNANAITVDAATSTVYVGTPSSGGGTTGFVTAFAASSLTVKKTINTGAAKLGFDSANGGRLAVLDYGLNSGSSNGTLSNMVGILNPIDGTLAKLTVGYSPHGLAVNPKSGLLYVADQRAPELTILDLNSHKVLTRAAVNPATDDGGVQPREVAVSVGLNRVYLPRVRNAIAVPESDLDVLDGTTGSLIQSITLNTDNNFVSIGHVAIDETRARVYITGRTSTPSQTSLLFVVDANTNGLVSTITVPDLADADVAVNPVTGRVYLSNSSPSGKVVIVNGITGAVVTDVDAGAIPGPMAVNTKTNKVYVGRVGQGDPSAVDLVTVIDGAQDKVESSFSNTTNGNVTSLVIDETSNTLFIGDDGNGHTANGHVTAYNLANNALLGQFDVGHFPHGMVFDQASRQLFAAEDADGTITAFQDGASTLLPPPHGGLSATIFTVNGSDSPTVNVTDTALRFAAQQTGTPAGLNVRVQATTTPNDEPSWTDLANGRSGRMTLDVARNQFVLNSTDYPLQNGVYFRAVSRASAYPDSISNGVGPFNLVSGKSHLGPTKVSITANSTVADLYFRATELTIQNGVALRIQSTTTPADEASWTDLNNGNAGHMQQSTNPLYPNQFLLLVNKYPAGQGLYFRAVASLSGFVDSISNACGAFNLVTDTPPAVTIQPPAGLPGSGDGHDIDHPVIVSAGNLHIGASAQTDRSITRLDLLLDGLTLIGLRDGSRSIDYTTGVIGIGDHVLEALAVDDLGATARAATGATYLRVIPATSAFDAERAGADGPIALAATGKTFTAVQGDGFWDNASMWKDQNGNNGVPGPDDFAIIGSGATVAFSGDNLTVRSISLNGGKLLGAAGASALTVLETLTITAGTVEGAINIIIKEGARFDMFNASDIQFTANTQGAGGLYNHGICNVHGAGGIRGLDVYSNTGTLNWQTPISGPLNAAVDPAAGIRMIDANSPSNSGLITGNVASLLTSDGASLITSDGAGVVSNDGGSLVSHDGGGLIGDDGSGLLSEGGLGLLSERGNGMIGQDGAGFISDNGAASPSRIISTSVKAASASSGFVQTGGETDLTHVLILGPAAINGGSLTGSGIIAGDVTNNSFISPGHSVGGISILGNYTQGAQGTLVVENGGAAPNQYDRLQVVGTANLGGKLDIRDINGYTPDIADTFSPLGFRSITGAFSSVSSNAQVTMTANGLLASVNPNLPSPKAGQPLNIATRMSVQTGDNVLIAGFIVTGPSGSTKKVLIRGMGPSLAQFGVPGTLSDPFLELHEPDGSVVSNDNWQQGDTSQIPNGFAPSDPRESVIVATLAPGNYSAVLKGAHGETGVGLAEVYDLDSASAAQLANISTRGFVNTGDNVMIGGFIVGGTEPTKILVRAIGPSLASFVPGALSATTLELHDANGAVISNEGWRNTQEADIIATTIPPSNDNEAAILATLVPGNYTAVVRGRNNTTGIGLVEAYNLQ
jgi:DNA-binding beta-propeller fold protein YncE